MQKKNYYLNVEKFIILLLKLFHPNLISKQNKCILKIYIKKR